MPRCHRGAFDTSALSDDIIHTGGLADTVDAVTRHAHVAVIAAGGYGAELADRLSVVLGVPTDHVTVNDLIISPTRQNCYAPGTPRRTEGTPDP
ncbi:hypothetical protein [Streptomyces mirabilis]|uniref:hypothetical protein n=1 Tax=Streptomyces mirabilis TaxID=68239 RepID=UPI003677D65F